MLARLPASGAASRQQILQPNRKETPMPRFIIQRTFEEGLQLPITESGAQTALMVVDRNADLGVTWLHSYFTPDRKKSFCVYDGPDIEAVRVAAQRNNLPIETVTEVRVLDPYFLV
jgi:hypothetical protein